MGWREGNRGEKIDVELRIRDWGKANDLNQEYMLGLFACSDLRFLGPGGLKAGKIS